jgi:hypothetical protein
VKGWRPDWFIPFALCFATSLAAAEALRGESPEARAALDRAGEFMGGTQVVYGMRTLVIASDNTREHDDRNVLVPTRTYYAFPLSVRQEITLNGRTIAMASSPGGGTLFTADGDSPLDHATRLGVERSTMRNPVVLLKSRLGRGFGAEVQGTEVVDGEPVDRLRLTQQDNETVLLIARKDGRPVEIRYDLVAAGGSKRSVTVRFSDWKTGASGLRYPHVARGREEGKQVFEVVTKSFEVDVPLSETLFSAGSDSAGYGVRPVR